MDSPPAPESRFIAVKGTRLHYLHWIGVGAPVLLLHGATHAGGVYAPLAARLAPGRPVYALDLRGHGLSGQPGDYSWTAFRDDVVQFIEALDMHDLAIVAHSRGAGVALLAAAAVPARVRGLLVYEPTMPPQLTNPASSAESHQERVAAQAARATNRRSTFASREDAFQHFRGRGNFKTWRDEYLRAFTQHCLVAKPEGGCELASPPLVEAAAAQARLATDAWVDVVPSPMPVTAIFGAKSPRMLAATDPVAPIRALYPLTEWQVLPEASHFGPQEHPEAFEALVRAFLQQLPTDVRQ